MRLLYCQSKWPMWEDPLPAFLARAAADGFDAVEIHLPSCPESPAEVGRQVRAQGLQLVAQITTDGPDPAAHLASLERHLPAAAASEPLLVNGHFGRDIHSFGDNCRLFARLIALAEEHSLLCTVETHRSRPTFAAHHTAAFLRELPDLRINADFSHWFCVHESDLSDQEEALELAIQRAWHVHARVGFDEGPQLAHPLGAAARPWFERHLALWRQIIAARRADGAGLLTITPEAGPPPYMPVDADGAPLADAWAVNVALREQLKKEWHADLK